MTQGCKPRSLRTRLALGAAALGVGAVAATGIVDAVTLRRFMQGQIDSRLDTQINTVTAALGIGPDGQIALRHDVEGPPSGRPDHPATAEALGADGEPLRIRSSTARIGSMIATVLAAAPLRALTDPLRDVLVNLAATLALLGAELIGAALVQIRVGLEPLRRLERDLAELYGGSLTLGRADLGGLRVVLTLPLADDSPKAAVASERMTAVGSA